MKVFTVVFAFLFALAFLFGISGNERAFAAVGECAPVYTSTVGDTLAALAQRCQVSRQEIRQANFGLEETGPLPVGRVVYIPQPVMPAQAGQIPVTGSSSTRVIKSGDTLARIAAQAGVSIGQILYANSEIKNPNLIYPGQRIILPSANSPALDEEQWLMSQVTAGAQSVEMSGIGYQPSSPNERWIRVDLATQTVHAFEGEQLVRSFLVSTGLPQTPTVTGTFKIWTRMRYDDMSGPGYDLDAVPYVMYFHEDYGLHGTYWHNNFGMPMSHGCVNLRTEDAGWLYEWASVGTVVVVR